MIEHFWVWFFGPNLSTVVAIFVFGGIVFGGIALVIRELTRYD